MPKMSSSRITSSSSPSALTVWPLYLPKMILSPTFYVERAALAVFADFARAHGDHFAHVGFFGGRAGQDDAGGGFFFGFQAFDDDAVV